MRDFFRLKVVSKRQVTIPQLMLEKLRLSEGDELEVEIEDGEILAVRPLKLVPSNFFSDKMLQKLEERSRSMDAGHRARQPEAVAKLTGRSVASKEPVATEAVREENIESASGA